MYQYSIYAVPERTPVVCTIQIHWDYCIQDYNDHWAVSCVSWFYMNQWIAYRKSCAIRIEKKNRQI